MKASLFGEVRNAPLRENDHRGMFSDIADYIDHIIEELEEANGKIEELEEAIEKLEDKVEALEEENKDLSCEIDVLNEKIEELEGE